MTMAMTPEPTPEVVTFIGDVHGNYRWHATLMLMKPATFQVGDCGFEYDYLAGFDPAKHKVLLGNHENYGAIAARPQPPSLLVNRWGIAWDKVGFLGGAWSIDKAARVPGYDWWSEEELSDAEFDSAIDLIAALQPPIIATHDCPASVFGLVHANKPAGPFGALYRRSRTGDRLEELFGLYQPELWIFGHHHRSADFKVKGTRFVGLDILEMVDVDLGTAEVRR